MPLNKKQANYRQALKRKKRTENVGGNTDDTGQIQQLLANGGEYFPGKHFE
jgi:hypothetical protein